MSKEEEEKFIRLDHLQNSMEEDDRLVGEGLQRAESSLDNIFSLFGLETWLLKLLLPVAVVLIFILVLFCCVQCSCCSVAFPRVFKFIMWPVRHYRKKAARREARRLAIQHHSSP